MIAFTRKYDKHFLKARTLKLSPSLSPSSPLPPDDNSSPKPRSRFPHVASLALTRCEAGAWESKGSPGARDVRDAKPICSHRPSLALPYIFPAHTYTHAAAWNFSRVPPSKRHMWLLSLRLAWDTSWSGTQAGAKAGVGH